MDDLDSEVNKGLEKVAHERTILLGEVDLLRSKLERREETIAELQEQLGVAKCDADTARTASQTSQEQIDDMSSRLASIDVELSEYREKYNWEKSENARLLSEKEQYTHKANASDTSQSSQQLRIDSLQSKLHSLQSDYDLQQERLEDKVRTCKHLREEADANFAQLRSLRKEKSEIMDDHIRELQQLEDERAEFEERAQRATSELFAYKQELQPTLRKACTERDELRVDQIAGERERERLQQCYTQAEIIIRELQEERDMSINRCCKLEEDLDESKNNITRLQHQLKSAVNNRSSQRPSFGEEEEKAAMTIQKAQRVVTAKRTTENKRLASEKAGNAAMRIQAMARTRAARKELDNRRRINQVNEISRLQRAVEDLEEESRRKMDELESSNSELADARASLDTSIGKEEALRRERTDLLRKNEMLQQLADEASNNRTAVALRSEKQIEEISALQEQLEDQRRQTDTQSRGLSPIDAPVIDKIEPVAIYSPQHSNISDTVVRHSLREQVKPLTVPSEYDNYLVDGDVGGYNAPLQSVGQLERAAVSALKDLRQLPLSSNTQAVSLLIDAVNRAYPSQDIVPSPVTQLQQHPLPLDDVLSQRKYVSPQRRETLPGVGRSRDLSPIVQEAVHVPTSKWNISQIIDDYGISGNTMTSRRGGTLESRVTDQYREFPAPPVSLHSYQGEPTPTLTPRKFKTVDMYDRREYDRNVNNHSSDTVMRPSAGQQFDSRPDWRSDLEDITRRSLSRPVYDNIETYGNTRHPTPSSRRVDTSQTVSSSFAKPYRVCLFYIRVYNEDELLD